MTREDTNLLFKDLCGRLPYRVKCLVNYTFCNETTDYEDVKSSDVDTLVTINQQMESYFFESLSEWFDFDEFKPYLFPMSSITEEQREEHKDLLNNQYSFDANGNVFTLQDFYCKYHIDFRGLIPKGLALDATDKNIY